jgi:hypothetical protein
MNLEGIRINHRLLDEQEISFFERDLENYANSLPAKPHTSADRADELRQFVNGYQNWQYRQFHNRYPLASYFVIDGERPKKET